MPSVTCTLYVSICHNALYDVTGLLQNAEPLGVIVLERCHPDRIQHDSRPYSFMLSFEGDDTRTYFLSAYSQDDLKGWMKAIKMAS